MRHIYEVLRLTHEAHRSQREIAASLGVSQAHVNQCLARFRATGLPWPLPPGLEEAGLEAQLYARPALPAAANRPHPVWATIHRELKRAGVTLQLLWLEYQQAHEGTPERAHCYQYTQFCQLYRTWTGHLDPVLRQEHKAGERVFVDYAGPTVSIVDADTGEVREAQIFVAALGASHLLFVEATWTQQLPDWIASHSRMLEFYGGVPALIVPDNLRTGVTHACFYEPTLNATYQDFATHYATAILPTRVARPRDKAKVESGVLITEREILAPLRDHRFSSLAALNGAMAERLQVVNERPFQALDGCRRSVFEQVERGALRPLPAERYEFAEWKTATVHIDYHIAVEGHFYSVPHPLMKAKVRVRLTATMIEVLLRGERVAVHRRALGPGIRGRYTTEPAHRPKSHQAHLDWTPERFVRWGAEIGPDTAAVVTHILERWPHPEQGYRGCLGLLSLSKRFTTPRLEAACTRARRTGTMSYKSIASMLRAGLDQLALVESTTLELPTHANVRGAAYYRGADAESGEAPGGVVALTLDLEGPAPRLPSPGESSC